MIDPKSAEVGGCWQGRNEAGLPCVWDPSVLEVAFEILTRSGENPFFIDIGANTGYCALLPALDRQMKGLAFEPNLEICSLLQKNIAMNGLEQNVQIMPLALGERPGTALLKIPASGVDSGLACMLAIKTQDLIHIGKDHFRVTQKYPQIQVVIQRALHFFGIRYAKFGKKFSIIHDKGMRQWVHEQKTGLNFIGIDGHFRKMALPRWVKDHDMAAANTNIAVRAHHFNLHFQALRNTNIIRIHMRPISPLALRHKSIKAPRYALAFRIAQYLHT